MIKIDLPVCVKKAMDILKENGHEAYIVGGCVRDSILNICPSDWDITTSAKPEEMLQLFPKTVNNNGLSHGTVTAVIDGETIEITTYRIDGEYTDNRKPDSVTFTTSLEEDLARRDFTINAMAYDDSGVIDYYNGLEDLKNGIIRCVGEAEKRFTEDALRMLRCIRFATRFNFIIDDKTFSGIKTCSSLINNISVERITSELNQILLNTNCSYGIKLLYESQLLKEKVFPLLYELIENHKNISQLYKALETVEPKMYMKLALIAYEICNIRNTECCDISIINIFKDMRYDNLTIKDTEIIANNMTSPLDTKVDIKRLMSKVGQEKVKDIISLKRVIAQSKNEGKVAEIQLDNAADMVNSILAFGDCFSLRDLKITGREIGKLGIKGQEIGKTLAELLDIVIVNPEKNTSAELLEAAEIIKNRQIAQ